MPKTQPLKRYKLTFNFSSNFWKFFTLIINCHEKYLWEFRVVECSLLCLKILFGVCPSRPFFAMVPKSFDTSTKWDAISTQNVESDMNLYSFTNRYMYVYDVHCTLYIVHIYIQEDNGYCYAAEKYYMLCLSVKTRPFATIDTSRHVRLPFNYFPAFNHLLVVPPILPPLPAADRSILTGID